MKNLKVVINNIGILDHVEVNCDGVTIITGKNGSGKSTFGKTLTALFAGLENASNLFYKNLSDEFRYSVAEIIGLNDFNLEGHYYFGIDYSRVFRYLFRALNNSRVSYDFYYYDRLISGIINEIDGNQDLFISFLEKHNVTNIREKRIGDIIDNLNKFRFSFELHFFDFRNTDSIISQSITNQFDSTFLGQVKPIDKENTDTNVSFYSNEFTVSYTYDNKSVVLNGDRKNLACFYIFDGNTIDKIYKRRFRTNFKNSFDFEDILLTKIETRTRDEYKLEVSQKYPEVFKIINQVYPYDFVPTARTSITTNKGVAIANEACGKKIFALIKELMYRELINSSTLLVFDEPDNHLHPAWQTLFAKLMLVLARDTGAHVFCITHSPTLLLAFDVLSKDEETDENKGINVLYCDPSNKEHSFEDVTNKIYLAHKALSDPYIDLDLFGKDSV